MKWGVALRTFPDVLWGINSIPSTLCFRFTSCSMGIDCGLFVVFFYGGDAGSFRRNLPIGQALSQGTFLILVRLRGAILNSKVRLGY